MEKKEFDEMIAINKALGGKYNGVLSNVSDRLGFEMKEDFTKKGLITYMTNLINRLSEVFVAAPKLNNREIAIDKIRTLFDNEINNKKYLISVQKILGKKETIESIIVPFLRKIKDDLGNSTHSFQNLILSINNSACAYDINSYINNLKNYQWNDAYKDESALVEPNWSVLYKNIFQIYDEEYVLTDKAYQRGIKEWIEGTKVAVINTAYKNYEVDLKELNYRIKIYFDKLPLPELSEIYKELFKNTASFFEKGSLGAAKDVVIDDQGRKFVSLISLQKHIHTNFSVNTPNISEKLRTSIKSDQLIPDALGATKGFQWLANALSNSVNENSPQFMEDELAKILDDKIDPENLKQRVKNALIGWRKSVHEALGSISKTNVPKTVLLKKDLTVLFNNYVSISGEISKAVLNSLVKELDSQPWENLKDLCQSIQDNVFTEDLVPTKKLFELWWDYFNGNFKNITSETMVNACLPDPSRIKEYFERNICLASKEDIIQNISDWKASIKNPFVNAVAPLSDFKDIEKTKFSGTKLKDEYWGNLFPEDERLTYFKETICAAIGEKDGLTATELDEQWNSGITSITPEIFWKDHLFKLYIEKGQDSSVLESWVRSKNILLPSAISFTPLVIKILLKLPISKRVKKPSAPVVSDKSLDGYITLFSKWNDAFYFQYDILGHTLQRFYYVFSEIADTRRDVKQNFDKFISDCNSELKATYDYYNFLSGTLGSLVKVGVIAALAFSAPVSIAAAGTIGAITATATATIGGIGAGTVVIGSLAGDVASGASNLLLGNNQPQNYNSEVKTTFKTITDGKYDDISVGANEISSRIIKIDAEIRKMHTFLTKIKIADAKLDIRSLDILSDLDKKIAKEYKSIADFITKLDNEIKKVNLSTIDNDFEGYMLKSFVLENINSGKDDILESSKFKNKLLDFNFCVESDFVDTYLIDYWADDVTRLRNNTQKYNPTLFK